MAKVTTYLNFMGNTEEAFTFYKSVFQTEFSAPIMYMRDVSSQSGQPELPDDEKNAVMHVALPTIAGHEIMGTDMLRSLGHELRLGNNVSINLMPDTRAETERLWSALSEGSDPEQNMPLADMFWGDYFGTVTDKYGIKWMFNCSEKKES